MQRQLMFTSSLACKCLAITLGFMLLSACSSAPGPKDIPAGTEFSTHILADNTKIFTLKIHPERDRGAGGAVREGEGRGRGGDCFPCEPGDARGGGMGGGMRARALDMKSIATAMIAENHFCREGFVVLEQFQQERSQIVRGECRDSADASDRARFTQ
jgi:hypothetical protein